MPCSNLLRRIVLILALLWLPTAILAGGFSLPGSVKLPDIPKVGASIPGLEGLLGDDTPVSTSFADAATEIPYLDAYSPEQPLPLEAMKKDSSGCFALRAGTYSFDAQSYCLHAGTYGPSKGDGYLYAPLKGSKAEVIRNIIEQSSNHPEIPQQNVQTLIWGIEARTKISEMSPEVQDAAKALLSKKQIASLNGGAFGVIPENQLTAILSKATEPVRKAMEFENAFREKLCNPSLSFPELEKVAVLTGDPPPNKDARVVPSMRWSYSPDGYFIRFKPHRYQATYFEVSCPDHYSIKRDDRGRITEMSDSQQNIIGIAYDDGIAPAAIAGDDGVKAYALSSIKFTSSVTRNGKPVEREWKNAGWMMAGIPSGKGKPEQGTGRFSGLKARYDMAVSLGKEFANATDKARRSLDRKKSLPTSTEDMNDMMDLSHLNAAISEVIATDAKTDAVIAWQAQEAIGAWQYVFKRSVNGDEVLVSALPEALIGLGVVGKTLSGDDVSQVTPLNPGKNVATPSDTGRQRLEQSSRSTGDKSATGSDGDNAIMKWFRDRMRDCGLDVTDEGGANGAQNGDSRTHGRHATSGSSSRRGGQSRFMALSFAPSASSAPANDPWDLVSATISQRDGQTVVGLRFTDTKSGRIVHLGKARANGDGEDVLNSTFGKAVKNAGL